MKLTTAISIRPVGTKQVNGPLWGPAFAASSSVLCGMDWADYLRDQGAKYRQLAEQAEDPVVKNELLELASVCDEVANNIEDHLTGG
jgi:hypothetical protein